jgi:outer membrane lipoprotein SlyB
MRTATIALTAALLVSGCADSNGYNNNARQWRQYDYNHADPSYGGYDAGRYYQEGPRRHQRRLSNRERIYRGQDGRYYCRNSDGRTGLVIGAIAGGIIGNRIAQGDSEILGTVIGAAGGALLGQAIDRGGSRCQY